MIIVFLNWIFIFFTTFTIGFAGLKLFDLIYKINFEKDNLHPTIISLLGLALVTSVGNYTSVFYRINWEFSLLISLISFFFTFIYRKNILSYFTAIKIPKIHYLAIVGTLCFIFIALVKAAGNTEVWDEGQYFLPLIRWIESYPVIPGTGLFHDRMAYNSAFHLSSAIYSHVYAFEGGLYDLNAYLFVIINLFFLGGVNRIITQKGRIKLSDLLMLFSSIALYRQLITSIDADYPHIFTGLIVFILFLRKKNNKKLKKWDSITITLTILILYLVSIKFLAIYFLPFILVLFYHQIKRKQYRNILLTLVIGTLYILPWFIRNVYLSGYLVYPIYLVDLFSFDWKIPILIAKNDYMYVSEHSKLLIERHTLYFDDVEHISVRHWLPLWWKNHMIHNLSALLTGFFLPPSLLALVYIFIKKGKKIIQENLTQAIILAISVFFLIFWFFQYPDVRFGWHWILFILVFTFYQLNTSLFKTPLFLIRYFCITLLFLALGRATYKTLEETDESFFSQNILFPQPVMTLEKFTTKKIGSIEVTVSEDMFCWGTNPPCMPKYYDELNIIMRGSTILDGFKLKE